MLRFLAILAFGLSVAFPAVASEGSIEDVIDSQMPASGVPGLAYAVVSDGEITAVGAHGVVRSGGDAGLQPDEQWEYSNINYQILGRLIEVVSGQDYQTYIATNILEPVGMEDSFVADGEIHDAMATAASPALSRLATVPEADLAERVGRCPTA